MTELQPEAARAELEAAGWFTDGRYDQMLAAGRKRTRERHADGIPLTCREHEQLWEQMSAPYELTEAEAAELAEQLDEAALQPPMFVLMDGTELPLSQWINAVQGAEKAQAYRQHAGEDPSPPPIPAELRQKILASGLVAALCREEAQAEEDELTALAGRYFAETQLAEHEADGVPADGIAHLRRHYIDGVLRSPAAAAALREHYAVQR